MLKRPIAMGYVATAFAEPGMQVQVNLRGRNLTAVVVALPFVEPHYYRGS